MALISPHGFVWPAGLPPCVVCGRSANDPSHITPPRGGMLRPQVAKVKHSGRMPIRAHAYASAGGVISKSVLCVDCRQPLNSSVHPVGIPSGLRKASSSSAVSEPATLAHREAPFVSEIKGKLVMATRVTEEIAAELVPSQVSEKLSPERSASAHRWLAGRYVEADNPNGNAAYWSTADLEMGLPTVNSGPVNWLHDEKHVIGAIVESELVKVDREAAATDGVGNHIRVLSALWPWANPREVAIVEAASEAGTLWLSMECISREVQCLTEDCSAVVPYRDYVLNREVARCEHMKDAQPRRFVDPIFQGAGVIVPPVRPGWAKADARVLAAEANSLIESQAASFEGLSDSDAEGIAALLIDSTEPLVDGG